MPKDMEPNLRNLAGTQYLIPLINENECNFNFKIQMSI